MTRLSVNINKVALIRNSRGEDKPNLIKFAQDCEEYGAQGITVHPRPDERHIRYSDLEPLKGVRNDGVQHRGYPNERFIKKVCEVKPHQVTLVPDPPGVLTSSEGWDTITNKELLVDVVKTFKDQGIRVSLFMDTDFDKIEAAKEVGADRIEFYTGHYARNFLSSKEEAVRDHVKAAIKASEVELGINAGHDLNLDNLRYYKDSVPNLLEVSIGHALIGDALYFGITKCRRNVFAPTKCLAIYDSVGQN